MRIASDLAQPRDGKVAARPRGAKTMVALPDTDGRSAWARRLRDLMGQHIADLGGDAVISEAQRSVIRRAAVLSLGLEQIEAGLAASPQIAAAELTRYATMSDALRRLLKSVGLHTAPRKRSGETTAPTASAA